MGASSSPVFPFPGGVAGAIPPNPEAGRPGHFPWSNWMRQFVLNLDTQSVKRSGDAMSGPLSVLDPTASTHAATKGYVDAMGDGMPVGAIIQFASTTPPAGWHLCDGSLHGSPALAAVLAGAADPNRAPDLRGAFIVGANAGGAGAPALTRTNYALRATGGADMTLQTAAQSGQRDHSHIADPPNTGTSWMHQNNVHGHGAWSAGHNTDHSHYVSLGGGGHAHGFYGSQNLRNMDDAGSGWQVPTHTADLITGGDHGHAGQSNGASTDHSHAIGVADVDINHVHSVDIPAFWTQGSGAANATEAQENRPPYFALVYLIKKA